MGFNHHRNLSLMLEDMERVPPQFAPTNFWQSGLRDIVEDIQTFGFEKFREHKSAVKFYAPMFRPGNGELRIQPLLNLLISLLRNLKGEQKAKLADSLEGRDSAMNEYSLYRVATDSCALQSIPIGEVSESVIAGGEYYSFDGKFYSRSMLNYLRALTYLNSLTKGDPIDSIMEIGGGYGTLGEIFLSSSNDNFYVNIDIPPLAAVSASYLCRVFGEDQVLIYEESRDLEVIDLDSLRKKYRAVVLCPWQLPRITGSVDLFANFISFQEMEPDVVENYSKLVQPLIKKYLLLRNSASGKSIAKTTNDLGVLEPVTTDFIIELFNDFQVLGRESRLYGYENRAGTFRSEVSVSKRKS
ncbi:putative sugar O-methyltransferase [Marinobacter sp. F4206]|uniref:putative sugar O-methyltransferase n=1 Tax=Marinobacter sp. F4206 TaxID=2861777 RepID=UPI001C60226A|nr:putative sugar O-methyltransferase [Marinobacter sp. F4206]MBW4935561.1 putative sugar O-methyltransferase [Marinobacter sp. F4206]